MRVNNHIIKQLLLFPDIAASDLAPEKGNLRIFLRYLHFLVAHLATVAFFKACSIPSTYVGHLESKERLRVQPAQLFNFS